MKIAVTSQGPDLSSQVDPRFGRAKGFIVVDTDTGEFSVHDNSQNLSAAQGAGIQAGRTVVDLGVTAVITGNVGPKAFATLEAGNVKIYAKVSGTVKEAIENLSLPNLETFFIYDLFSGPSVPRGKISLSVRFIYHHPQRTLQAEEVDKLLEKVIKTLTERFHFQLREGGKIDK